MKSAEKKMASSIMMSADWLVEEGAATGVVGTPYYMALEVVMGKEYSEKVDVWSAGVVLYTMLAGILPFYGDAEIFEAILRANLRFPTRVFRLIVFLVELIWKMVVDG
ncbi:hypothetical protein JRO89_XS02G0286500 [Xanthoceras sorbifolium]|uniref:Protein kinase domain-containing protein n=1 Tax=Xanthoceras sorbifolium TaxID=99658 RepID=A0ABQ8IHR6_9ROSI|nr:hypothetical protein JRO89_XS02G0286500 [Xanthoceras sorbifolium]